MYHHILGIFEEVVRSTYRLFCFAAALPCALYFDIGVMDKLGEAILCADLEAVDKEKFASQYT